MTSSGHSQGPSLPVIAMIIFNMMVASVLIAHSNFSCWCSVGMMLTESK